MANTVIKTRSNTTPGSVPSAGSLQEGELAINTGDGRLYVKLANASVVQVSPQGGSNTYLQFNDSGSPGGDANLVWNKSTSTMSVVGTQKLGNSTINATSNSSLMTFANSVSTVYVGKERGDHDNEVLNPYFVHGDYGYALSGFAIASDPSNSLVGSYSASYSGTTASRTITQSNFIHVAEGDVVKCRFTYKTAGSWAGTNLRQRVTWYYANGSSISTVNGDNHATAAPTATDWTVAETPIFLAPAGAALAKTSIIVKQTAGTVYVGYVFAKKLHSVTDTTHNAPGCVSPEQFGAAGDYLTDDTVALQAAFDAAAVSGDAVLLNGKYIASNTITVSSNNAVSVVGRHSELSGIYWDMPSGSDGLVMNFGGWTTDGKPNFSDVSFRNANNNSVMNAILRVSYATLSSGAAKGIEVKHCNFGASDDVQASSTYADKCIELTQCPHTLVFDCWFQGKSGFPVAANRWLFDGGVEGFTGANASLSSAGSYVAVTPSTSDPGLVSPAISVDGSVYTHVRAKVRRTSGSGAWDGTVFYSTGSHSFSASYYKQVADPGVLNDEWVEIAWDMSALDAGGSDWTSSTITGIRLDLAGNNTDVYEVDWVDVTDGDYPLAAIKINEWCNGSNYISNNFRGYTYGFLARTANSDFQCEGQRFMGNKFESSDHGIYMDLQASETGMIVCDNAFDTRYTGVYIKNIQNVAVKDNLFFWKNDDLTWHSDVMILTTNNDSQQTPIANDTGVSVTGNQFTRNGLELTVTGATQADPCVLTFLGNTSVVSPGELVFVSGIGGMTELNSNGYGYTIKDVATVNATHASMSLYQEGTVTTVNASGYGAFSSNGTVSGYGVTLWIKSGKHAFASGNKSESREVHYRVDALTEYACIQGNYTRVTAFDYVVNSSATSPFVRGYSYDGDLGDVTVSNYGNTWTIPSGTVTRAKTYDAYSHAGIEDGGFEAGGATWTFETNGFVAANDSTNARTGNWVAVNDNTSGSGKSATSFPIRCSNNAVVTGGAYWKSSASLTATVNRPRLVWLDKDGASISTDNGTSNTTANTSYNLITVAAVAPANTAFVQLEWQTTKTGGNVYVDDAFLYVKADASYLLSNGTVTTAQMGGDVTTAGKALLDDANNSVQRTTLGLGTAATINITVSNSSPGSPSTGDVWIDTN